MIYLKGDTEKIVRRAIAYRGTDWAAHISDMVREYPLQQRQKRMDKNGMIQFFVDSYALFETILQTCPWRVITFDTMTSDWATYQSVLLKECHCTQMSSSFVVTREQKEKYIGIYSPPSYFPDQYRKPIVVEADNDNLVVHFGFLKNLVLLPQSKNQFAIRGRSEQMEFVLNEQEQAVSIVYPFVRETRHLCKKVL